MRISTKLLTLGLAVTVLVSTFLYVSVSAQDSPTTDAQISRIKTNCISAKNTLSQLHASDALLRVNRGQIYESMTTKLMTRFNSRVDSNGLDSKSLTSITSSYGTALTKFRIDYKSYEEQLSLALKIDCSKEPVSFYDSVASARTKRAQVHNDVTVLHQFIDQYGTAFNTFADNFNSKSGASN